MTSLNKFTVWRWLIFYFSVVSFGKLEILMILPPNRSYKSDFLHGVIETLDICSSCNIWGVMRRITTQPTRVQIPRKHENLLLSLATAVLRETHKAVGTEVKWFKGLCIDTLLYTYYSNFYSSHIPSCYEEMRRLKIIAP